MVKLIWGSGEEPGEARREAERAAARRSGDPRKQPYFEHVMQTGARRLRTMFEQGDIEGAVRLIRAARELRQMLNDTACGIAAGVNQHYHGTSAQLNQLQSEIVADADRMFKELLTHYRGDPYRPAR